jgi:transcriptional regulator with XRE-family HTH domain
MKQIDVQFGKNLRKWRIKQGLSQEKLAEKADSSQVYVSQIEHGKYSPSVRVMVKLAKALGVPPARLFEGF